MAFKFPWSNLHELNLDWILSVVKRFSELIPPMETAVDDVQALQGDVAQAVEDAQSSVTAANQAAETAAEALEVAEQAAAGTIADGAVITSKLADGAVTSAKIEDGTIQTVDMADGSITSIKLASNAVTTAKIADGAVLSTKLSDDAVTNEKIADNAVTNAKLADNTVNTAEIVAGAVTNAKIADGAVTEVKLDSALINKINKQVFVFATLGGAFGTNSTFDLSEYATASLWIVSVRRNGYTSVKVIRPNDLPAYTNVVFRDSFGNNETTVINFNTGTVTSSTTQIFIDIVAIYA